MTTPNAMPAKLLGRQIVGDLLRGGMTTRKETRVKFDKKNQKYVDVVVDVPVPILAANVSEDNVERIAKAML